MARSIIGSFDLAEMAWNLGARQALDRARDAFEAMDDPTGQSMPAERRLLRAHGFSALALRATSLERPMALMIDDYQWANRDSIRLLRYAIRGKAKSRLFIVIASRSNEIALVNEAVTLLADMDRMGLLRRLKLSRLLGSPV